MRDRRGGRERDRARDKSRRFSHASAAPTHSLSILRLLTKEYGDAPSLSFNERRPQEECAPLSLLLSPACTRYREAMDRAKRKEGRTTHQNPSLSVSLFLLARSLIVEVSSVVEGARGESGREDTCQREKTSARTLLASGERGGWRKKHTHTRTCLLVARV